MNKLAGSAIFAIIVAGAYAWLGVSMNIFNSPLMAVLGYYPVFCVGGAWVLYEIYSKREPVESGRFSLHPKPVVLTLLLSVIALFVVIGRLFFIRPGMIDPEAISEGMTATGINRTLYLTIGLVVAIINPFFEERLWRYGVFQFLRRHLADWPAIIVSSLLFAGYHPLVVAQYFPTAWLTFAFFLVFIGGLFFAWLYMKTGKLIYPIALHGFVNVAMLITGSFYTPS